MIIHTPADISNPLPFPVQFAPVRHVTTMSAQSGPHSPKIISAADNVQIFRYAIYKHVRTSPAISPPPFLPLPNLIIGVGPGFQISLSSTLVSRMMLRLRSDGGKRHYRDSRACVTNSSEQTTVLTLSDLLVSGELPSVPPTVRVVHGGGYGTEDSALKRDLRMGPGL
jgi:hypothetical protein